jgi:hypothetical protein
VVTAAVEACKELENGALDKLRPSDKVFRRVRARATAFANCMRLHGAEIGRPLVRRNRIGISVSFPNYTPALSGLGAAYAACKTSMNVFGS